MTPNAKTRRIFTFGPFQLDLFERVLRCNEKIVPLAPKLFDTLELLVENSGHIVEKDEMMERLWQDAFVEESSLSQNVFQLRKILKDRAAGSNYIETIPKRGYRFTAASLDTSSDERLGRKATQTTIDEARRAYLLGTYFSNKRTNEAIAKSIDYFQEAVVYDPKFAAAHAGLADSYFWLAYHEGDPDFRRESFELSRTSALKGIEIDPATAEGHTALATVKIKNDGDAEGAETSFKAAIAADPNCAMAYSRYTYFLAAMGRLNDASMMIKRAHAIDPLSPDANSSLAMILYMQRNFNDAIRHCKTALAIEPTFTEAMLLLGRCYEQKGAFNEAASQYEKAKSDNTAESNELLSHLFALTGKNSLAEMILSELASVADACETRPFNIAATHAALGDYDIAFEWLERPYINWTERLRMLHFDPRLDTLRTDPRFTGIVERAVSAGPYQRTSRRKTNEGVHDGATGVLFQ